MMRQFRQQELPMDMPEPTFELVAETPKDVEKRQKAAVKAEAAIVKRNQINLLAKTPKLF